MAFEIYSTSTIRQYQRQLLMELQQQGSKLFKVLDPVDAYVGTDLFLTKQKQSTAVDLVDPLGNTDPKNLKLERRRMVKKEIKDPIIFGKKVADHILTDPTQSIMKNQSNALGRKLDVDIINWAKGTAYVGNDAGTATTLPLSQKITASSGLTMSVIRQIRTKFNANDVAMDNKVYMIIGSQQVDELMQIDEFVNRDYQSRYPLENYMPVMFAGITFIPLSDNVIPTSTSGSDTYRNCIAFTSDGIGVTVAEGFNTKIDVLPERNHSIQVVSYMSYAGVRTDENAVMQINCKE